MSITNGGRRKAFFVFSGSTGAFILGAMLLAGGLALGTPTSMTVLAQVGNNTTTGPMSTSGNTTTASSAMEFSPQPVYQENLTGGTETPINQTHIRFTVSGQGTLTLPNSTESIRVTSTATAIGTMFGTATGEEVITTEDGNETATAKFFEILRFNMQDGSGRGIITAVVHTNSTGVLEPLDGMILVGQEELQPDGSSMITMWEWESGIPYVKMSPPPSSMEDSSTNTTMSGTSPTSVP